MSEHAPQRRAATLLAGAVRLDLADDVVTIAAGATRLVLTVEEARAVAAVGIPAVLPPSPTIKSATEQAAACQDTQTTPQPPQTPAREPLF